MQKSIILMLLAVALLVVACTQTAQTGNIVTVDYSGSFTNGTLFDTNIANVARAQGFDAPDSHFVPLVVTIGKSQLIQGFEDALVGMKKGEKKRVTLPPEQAYGKRFQTRVNSFSTKQEAPRIITAKRDLVIPTLTFLEEHPNAKENDTVISGNNAYTVKRFGLDNVILQLEVKAGDTIQLPNTFWDSVVLNVTDSDVIFRQDPANNTLVRTALGPAQVIVSPETIALHLLLEPGGMMVHPQLGTGRVISVNETSAEIDFNHPLAGETLIFNITVTDIKQAK